MKIVLIQPKSFHTWEVLNIGYLISTLKAGGFTNIDFYSGFFDSDETIFEGCKDADLIGFSCTSPQMRHGLALARRIKRKENYVVFGGFHPSAVPEETLENDCIDSVVVGEGERAFLDIANGARERIVKRDLIDDLDEIPFPDRYAIKQGQNIKSAQAQHGMRLTSIFSSRGCPFRCTFCASHAVWTRRQRLRSPENILDEFEQVVSDWKIDFVMFADDEVALDRKHFALVCEEKLRRGEPTLWGANVVASTLNEELLRLMYRAGCRELWIGVESGSAAIMKDTKKPITPEKVKWAFDVTRKIGFKRRAYFLLGMPNESMEDIRRTDAFIEEIQPDVVGFTILAPYPGTAHYDPVLHKEVDWSDVDEYENRMTATATLSNEDLHREQARLVKKYQYLINFRQRQPQAGSSPVIPTEALSEAFLPGRSGL